MTEPVRFDVWVCRGRLCSAGGSAAVFTAMTTAATARGGACVLRGGCYGLCELGPNVVVRRRSGAAPEGQPEARPGDPEGDDRLSLKGGPDETVYCGVGADDVDGILEAHLERDEPLLRLTRAAQERIMQPRTPIEERIRALRAARTRARVDGASNDEGSHD